MKWMQYSSGKQKRTKISVDRNERRMVSGQRNMQNMKPLLKSFIDPNTNSLYPKVIEYLFEL